MRLVMHHCDDSAVFKFRIDDTLRDSLRLGVDTARCFVEYQDPAIPYHRSRKTEQLQA